MSNDALERLKQRQRPTVPIRDASLTSESVDTSISRHIELKQPQIQGELITKQSTLRLEAQLSDRLSAVCRDNGISREVFIEALFQYYESNPQEWQAILTEAKSRGEQRQQVANFRRAQSMMERFGNQS